MRLLTRTGTGDRGRRRTSVRRGLALALLLALAPAAKAAAQVPDTLAMENRATATYRAEGQDARTEASAWVTMQLTPGVRIAPPRQTGVRPGERRVLSHRLDNLGTGPDRFSLAATGPAGWRIALHLDLDGDGVLGAGDAPVPAPVALARGASAALLLVVDVPEDAPDDGEGTVKVTAASGMDPAVRDSVLDLFLIHRPLPAMTLGKAVDRADAAAGDTLAYTLSFANRGDAVAPDATIVDPLPLGARLVAGSLALNGAPLTDAADNDAGTVERGADGRETVRVRVGDLLPSAAGTVTLRAVVAADATGSLENVATLSYVLPGSAQPVTVTSPAVATQVTAPRMALEKTREGADSVRLGAEVAYRLAWSNTSNAVAVREAVLVDTLPDGLALVSAEGEPEIDGRVLRWRLGTVNPGEQGAVRIVARAAAPSAEGGWINRATLRAANAAVVSAAAAAVAVSDFLGDELEVSKTAGVLEAGLGDAVPYAVTLRNKGLTPIAGIVLRDSLPEGVRYLADRTTGADSARIVGRELTMWVAGPLLPGGEHVVRYAVTVVSPGRAEALENRVVARGEGGRVVSAAATAWVRLRRGYAMQQRVVVGKVWVDADGDGRQGEGEGGAAGVEVWSEDGEVVTTDAQGRFSFPNLRAGEHALRLDTVGIPAGTALARASDEIVRVRLDGWTLPRADFRLVPRAVLGATAGGSSSAGGAVQMGIGNGVGTTGPASPASPISVSDSTSTATVATIGMTTTAAGADTAARPVVVVAPTVAPLRTAAEREEEQRQSFVSGPVVRIASPVDGAVVASNRLYVGVAGEPGARVRLFVGEAQIGEGLLRPDGKMDFVGVEIEPGPARVRVSMTGTNGVERWDSVSVHRSGDPARLELPEGAVTMRAGERAQATVRVRVLDEWGVPVAGGAALTVEAAGAAVDGPDADLSSVGPQTAVGADGWASVVVTPGHDVGPGELRLSWGKVRGRVPLRVLPSTRPLIVTGAAQVGVGATREGFGSMTARGAVGRETTVSVSVDSRRGDGEEEFFDRGFDPLDEGRYPTLGDASERRVVGGSTQTVTARVERGFDWVELGDVRTAEFGVDERLGWYQRALTGVAGRVTTGPVTWRGFGSVTDQVFSQRQLRGDGSSGPYRFGGPVRPGTDRLAVEVRARDNAARVISRQELVRHNDYQIDYLSGDVLLSRPVPATDAAGNPVFVVAMLERRSGGEARFVGGARMDLDAARILRTRGLDSLNLSLLGVRDEAGDGASPEAGATGGDLLGGGLRVRRGGLTLGGQLLRSTRADSSALAGRAELAWSFLPGDRGRIEAEWLGVGSGFAPGTDPRLSSGLSELRVAAELRPAGASRIRLGHERQRFDGYEVERATTTLRAEQSIAGRALTAEGGVTSDVQGEHTASAAVGKVTMAATPELDLWIEGTQALSVAEGARASASRPDQIGIGAAYQVISGVRVEGAHRWVRTHGDSASTYGLSSVGLRFERLAGSQLWGAVERTDGASIQHSAVLGWSQRVAIAGGWALTGLYERRFGLNRASLLDPNRALPFAQVERDRWSAGAGVEWLPSDSAPRFSMRGEVHGGADGRGHRFDLAGDAPLGPGVALLTRHDWLREERSALVAGRDELSRRDRSLVGLALRPVGTDALNLLGKVEWRRTVNPLGGGVLAGAGDERRLIGAADAVWAAGRGTELAARYAVRWASLADTAAGVPDLTSFAHFVGARADQDVRGPLRVRLDGRMLLEAEGGSTLWNLAPALVGELGNGLELEAGYRFGRLEDPDFARGGTGFFANLSLRFTERLLGDVAGFWRERLARDP